MKERPLYAIASEAEMPDRLRPLAAASQEAIEAE